jgi:RNA polymerase sigma factor (sigma-70 family)
MNDQQAIPLLKQGDKNTLGWVYKTYRDVVAHYVMKHYSYTSDDAIDVFTDALVILEKKTLRDPDFNLTSSLQTYIVGIVKNLLHEKQRGKHYYTPLDDFFEGISTEEYPWDTDDTDAIIERMIVALDNMGDPCHTIIKQHYFERKKDSEVKILINYKNEDAVKAQRWKCIQQLRKLLNISKTRKK